MSSAAARFKVGDRVQHSTGAKFGFPFPCKVTGVRPNGVYEVGSSSLLWRAEELELCKAPKRKQRDEDDRPLQVGDRVRRTVDAKPGGVAEKGDLGEISRMAINGVQCWVRWDKHAHTSTLSGTKYIERVVTEAKKAKTKEEEPAAAASPYLQKGDRVRRTSAVAGDNIKHDTHEGDTGTINVVAVNGFCMVKWDSLLEEALIPTSCIERINDTSSSSSAAAAASLDPTEQPAKEGEIKWFVVEPAHLSTFEVVHEGLQCGVKCTEADLHRLGGKVFPVLLDCAKKEGTQRITVPDAAFTSVAMMHAFFKQSLVMGMYTNTTNESVELVHAADALDLMHLLIWKNVFNGLVENASALSYTDAIALGVRYKKDKLVASGATKLLREWSSMTKAERSKVPDHILARCAPHWIRNHGTHCSCKCTVPIDSSSSDSSDSDDEEL